MNQNAIRFHLPEPLDQAREHMLGEWGESMVRVGMAPSGHGEVGCNFVGRYRSWWVYVICVVFFPIGLLALLIDKNSDSVQVELFDGDDGGTQVEVAGKARRKVWRAVQHWAPA